jgi:uncharacterized protein (DUF1501 family)
MLSRRTLLKASAASGAAWILSRRSMADGADEPRANKRTLVVLQLFGGNDGFNTLVRPDDDHYRRARPNVALRANELLPLLPGIGLHPALVHLREHYLAGQVGIVEGIGIEHSSLSHFRCERVWESGRRESDSTGWIGRWFDAEVERGRAVPSATALIALGRSALPDALRAARVSAPVLPSLERVRSLAGANALDAVAIPARSTGVAADKARYVDEALRATRRACERLARACERTPSVTYPRTVLGRGLCDAAHVIAADVGARVVYTTLTSFDTHTRQRAEQAPLLADLDGSLHAFLGDLAALGRLDDTLIVTVSEFGRRLAENGIGADAGTDHGRSSLSFVLGGAVRGGLYGEPPRFDALDEDGNVPATVDFRRLYATAIDRWLGGNSRDVLGGEFDGLEVLPA